MARTALSRPVALALEDGLLPEATTFFDYGCGRGGDLERLTALGYHATGWDPVHRPTEERHPADVVNLGYVANVIEDPEERRAALRGAWALAQHVLVVAARLDWEAGPATGTSYGDGIVTLRGTFQKFYTQEELRSWIDSVIGVRSVVAAPGIFYVFRDDVRAQRFLAARVRHRPAAARSPSLKEALYAANRELLDPLLRFVAARGRAPEPFELPEEAAIRERFGSVRAALSVVRRVSGDEAWEAARSAATDDLTVYLALAAFRGRPKFTALPTDVQVDVRSFFGSYRAACAAADTVLFGAGDRAAVDRACRASAVGKLTPEALYVHVSALGHLDPLLRVYEGCGRTLIGTVEGATIAKLNRLEPKVSYLVYPDFDRDPHPSLTASVRADLIRLHVRYREFRSWANPPILHRKETFVGPDYPDRDKFARLTAHEEKLGLLSEPLAIGMRDRWTALVAESGHAFRGHRLVRCRPDAVSVSQAG
jgi:DNA phosphorothioation-associated putative methyltransferase